MTRTVLERTGEQIAATAESASRIGNMLYDRLDGAKVATKRKIRAAEELLDDTRLQIKKHPATSVAGAFVAGLVLGTVAGWMIRRK